MPPMAITENGNRDRSPIKRIFYGSRGYKAARGLILRDITGKKPMTFYMDRNMHFLSINYDLFSLMDLQNVKCFHYFKICCCHLKIDFIVSYLF